MLRYLTRPSLLRLNGRWTPQWRCNSSIAGGNVSDPLRILFCGSDDFSCVSLKALHEEKERNQGLIKSIDVVVRPPKPTGRGNKTIRQGKKPALNPPFTP